MIFPTLSAQLAQVLPEPLKNKLGLQQPQGSSTQDAPQDRYTKNPANPAPEAHPTWAKAKNTLSGVFHLGHAKKSANNGQLAPPNGNFPVGGSPNPAMGNPGVTQAPGVMSRGPDHAAPLAGTNLKPMSVDEMFKRMPKRFQPKKFKYSLTPDEIRPNPQKRYAECIDHMVEAMPWRDDDIINPIKLDY